VATSADRPNILLILTDQHRLSAVGCYGDTPCETPNLDRLAAEGTLFTTAYTACPVCSPARATIMTGQYPHRHGVCSNVHNLGCSTHELPDGPHLLSRRLAEQGYRCGYSGKWHLGTGAQRVFGAAVEGALPTTRGFEGQDFPGHGGGGFAFPEYRAYLEQGGWRHEVGQAPGASYEAACNGIVYGTLAGPTESTVPHFLASHTIELIDRFGAAGDPFFIWHNFWGPHGPYYAPAEYFERYRDVEIPEWPNHRWPGAVGNAPHQVKLHPRREALTWEDWADAVRHYYAFTALIDEEIGRLIDHLEACGLIENTVILFSADHGETLGSHGGLTDKGWHHFEETHRLPCIARVPSRLGGSGQAQVRPEWVSQLDLYPTILDLAGGQIVEGDVPGRSLAPLLRGESVPWRDRVFTEFNGVNNLATSMVTARRGSLKYGWNCSCADELYDLERDPWELRNVAAEPEYGAELLDMRRAVAEWMEQTGYPGLGMYAHSRLGAGAR